MPSTTTYRLLSLALAASSVSAHPHAPVITAPAQLARRAELPQASGTSVLDAVSTIAAGQSFDGGMVQFDRGVSCSSGEGGDEDAVFELEEGASISNVIIGPDQIEGIHCMGSCTVTNVWWAAVCEDAFSVKEQGSNDTTTISGGGAFGAEDKVIQHNGAGTVEITGFYVEEFGKLYRSCGNCDEMFERHVIISDVEAVGGSQLAGINSNYGDTATISNVIATDVSDICVEFEGNDTGDEPEEISSGPSEACIYDEGDISTS